MARGAVEYYGHKHHDSSQKDSVAEMQRGKIFRKGSSWHLRYKEYALITGRKTGEKRMQWRTTSRKLADIDLRHRTQDSVKELAEEFLKTINPVNGQAGARGVLTFGERAQIFLKDRSEGNNPVKPATLKNWRSHLNLHILPVFEKVLLPEVTNKAVKDFVVHLADRVGPKSVKNIVQVIKMVKASAVNDKTGDELYPTKWNHDFIDMPKINAREQRRHVFAKKEIEAIINAADRKTQMLTILLAASGLRAGEALGLEIKHCDGSSVRVEQEAWHSIVQKPKTANAERVVDLDPRVAALLKSFVANRTTALIFLSGGKHPIQQSNFLRREFHPLLKSLGMPQNGLHGLRFRNTYLRNTARCPDGLLKFWLGHAEQDMSDRYDMIRHDRKYRQRQAKAVGVGFTLPRGLKEEKAKSEKFVVRRVVRLLQTDSPKVQIPA